MPQEKSCGAVVFRENSKVEYLLLHYEAGHWDFVKGNVEPNESEKDTAMRELKEETGILEAHFIEDFRDTINYFYKRGGKTIYKEVIFFLIQTKDSRVKLSSEHIGYEWLDYQEALERLTFKNAKKMLQKAHEFLKSS
jgi:8-oxo-dGTP pyrophosphatase MutT (NUDIX family)